MILCSIMANTSITTRDLGERRGEGGEGEATRVRWDAFLPNLTLPYPTHLNVFKECIKRVLSIH